MTVQVAVRTVVVPRQAGPVEPPPAAVPAPAPLLGRDRPLTRDEREFVLGLVGLLVFLQAIIITGIVLAETVWS